MTNKSEKWDKEEKSFWHTENFPGTTKAIWRLLYLLNFISINTDFTIEKRYKNPYHLFHVTSRKDKICVYMDGERLDPAKHIQEAVQD